MKSHRFICIPYGGEFVTRLPNLSIETTKMALPTLQPFWMKNYKNTTEALMVKRNQNQSEFREKWDKNSQFFKKSEVETAKQTGWASNQSFQRRFVALFLYCIFLYLSKLCVSCFKSLRLCKLAKRHYGDFRSYRTLL